MTQEYVPQPGDLVRFGTHSTTTHSPLLYLVVEVNQAVVTVQSVATQRMGVWPFDILGRIANLQLVSRPDGGEA